MIARWWLISPATPRMPCQPFSLLVRYDSKRVPFVRLSDLYDYFFSDGAVAVLTGPKGERAREIRSRIDEAPGLDDLELRVLKSLGILNLLNGADRLVASAQVIEEATVGPGDDAKERRGARTVLERLVERSLVTYRDFADEYRVWEGSDFDARGHISAARDQLTSTVSSGDKLCESLPRHDRFGQLSLAVIVSSVTLFDTSSVATSERCLLKRSR